MKQSRLPFEHELVIDLFAGGGGASLAMGQTLGRDPDIAINHDMVAISMHRANHPKTQHFCEDVFAVDPLTTTRGQPVGLLHASPDCTHHSQARGGQPRSTEIRSLSWVVLKWAGRCKPRCITLENVEQILQWSPLVAKRDKETGRVITIDRLRDPESGKWINRVAAPGEYVSLQKQFLVPCTKRRGHNWQHFVSELRGLGYTVQWKKLKACDYGAGTTRERLFLMARRDGLPIKWPKQTHGKKKNLQPLVTAADCIDWSLPCPSIFARKKPLAEATLRRIAKGVKRFVIDATEPFIVSLAHGNSGSRREYSADDPLGTQHAGGNKYGVVSPSIVPVTHQGSDRVNTADEALKTITTAKSGEMMVCAPIITGVGGRAGQTEPRPGDESCFTTTKKADAALVGATLIQASYGERKGQEPRVPGLDKPLGTVVAGGIKHAVVAAHLSSMSTAKHDESRGREISEAAPTITATPRHAVVAAHLTAFAQNAKGINPDEPLQTVLAGAPRYGAVTAHLTEFRGGHVGKSIDEPMPTITAGGSMKRPAGAAHALGEVAVFLEQADTGMVGHDAREAVSTVRQKAANQRIVAAQLTNFHASNTNGGQADPREPASSIMAGGTHKALIECTLSPEDEAGALRVAAFLIRYYSAGGQWSEPSKPLATLTTKERIALVTVVIKGTPYVIVDIGLRMLVPPELFKAQGFPADYIITFGFDEDGTAVPLTKTSQVRMVGNSVSPPPYAALLRANFRHERKFMEAEVA